MIFQECNSADFASVSVCLHEFDGFSDVFLKFSESIISRRKLSIDFAGILEDPRSLLEIPSSAPSSRHVVKFD